MKKNWNKFFKNLKSFKHMNTNNPIETIDEIPSEEQLENNPFLSQIQKILDKDIHRKGLLNFCDQNFVLSFEDVFNEYLYRDLVRFDYGSYAELFSGYDNETNELIVLKLIRAVSSDIKSRLRGPDFGSKCGTFEEIHNEFQISEALSRLRSSEKYETHCFPKVIRKYLVCGDIPQYLSHENSEQLPPIKEDVFEDFVYLPREYAVLIMSFGGQPLWKAIKENTINGSQLLSVVKQLILGLAIAELAVEFEHRDLHISNILINNTTKHKIHFIYNFNRYSVDSEGFEATIIDTTFSRIRIGNRIHSKNLTNIMKFDENSFLTSQDKCYKSMVKLTNNDWNKFTPKSNINWLSYICKVLLKTQTVKNSDNIQIKEHLKELVEMFKQINSLQELDFKIICE